MAMHEVGRLVVMMSPLRTARILTMLVAFAASLELKSAQANHYILPCDDDCRDAGAVIGPGTTGAWGVPGQGTYDFMLEVLPGQPAMLSAACLTFAPEGGPMWIVARGAVSGNHATLSAYRGVGNAGQFPTNSNPANFQLVYWGTMTFMFGDCNTGHVDSTAAATSEGVDIVRLTQPMGLDCPRGVAIQNAPPGSSIQFVPGDTPDTDPLPHLGELRQP